MTEQAAKFDISGLRMRTKVALSVPVPDVKRLGDGRIDWASLAPQIPKYHSEIIEAVIPFNNIGDTTDYDSLRRMHLKPMMAYFDVLYSYPDFREILGDKPKEFTYFVVGYHDLYRFVTNGKFPLVYTEDVSGAFVRRTLNKMFKPEEVAEILQYFHTIDWIIGRQEIPIFNQVPNPIKSALITKAIDTLAKFLNGMLAQPSTNFAEGGRYEEWLKAERTHDRFPIQVWWRDTEHTLHRRKITLEEYALRDSLLTDIGMYGIEQVTGEPIDNIWLKVREQLEI